MTAVSQQVADLFRDLSRTADHSLDERKSEKLLELASKSAGMQAFVQNSEKLPLVLKIVAKSLDSPHVGIPVKMTLIRFLSLLAKDLSTRQSVVEAMDFLGESFEKMWHDKLEAQRYFGTSVGRLDELLIVLFIRISSYKFSASDCMEFLEGNAEMCVSLITNLLQMTTPGSSSSASASLHGKLEDELMCCLCSMLADFTLPDTWVGSELDITKATASFSLQDSDDRLTQYLQLLHKHRTLETLNNKFKQPLADFLKKPKSKFGVWDEEFGATLPKQGPVFHLSVRNVCECLLNLHLFAMEGDEKLVKEMIESNIAQELLLGYCRSCAYHIGEICRDTLSIATLLPPEMNVWAHSRHHLVNGLIDGLQTLSLAAFCAPPHVLSFVLLRNSFSYELLKLPNAFLHNMPHLIAHVLLWNCNADSLNEDFVITEVDALGKTRPAELPHESKPSSLKNAIKAITTSIPDTNKEALIKMFFSPTTSRAPIARHTTTHSIISQILLGSQSPPLSPSVRGGSDSPSQEPTSRALPPQESPRTSPKKERKKVVAGGSSVAKSGAGGASVETTAKEDVESEETAAKSRAPKEPEELPNLKRTGGGFFGKVLGGSSQQKAAAPSPTAPRDASPTKRPSTSLKPKQEVPSEFLCALSKSVMKTPVSVALPPSPTSSSSAPSPVFEKVAILSHLEKNGNICPVTQKPLQPSDLKIAKELQKKIMAWKTISHLKAKTFVSSPKAKK